MLVQGLARATRSARQYEMLSRTMFYDLMNRRLRLGGLVAPEGLRVMAETNDSPGGLRRVTLGATVVVANKEGVRACVCACA